jgi:hypothetical protein
MDWTYQQQVWYTIYFILAALSITGALLVGYSILRYSKSHTTFSNVVFALHVSLCINEIATLPYVFSGNNVICIMAEMVHYYSTLMNYFSLAVLIQAHMCNVIDELRAMFMGPIERYGLYIVYLAPLMVLFRFIDPLYSDTLHPWCTVHASSREPLYVLTYYMWLYMVIVVCTLEVFLSTFYIYRRTDKYMAWRYFSSIGFYMLIALAEFLPNVIITAVYASTDDDGNFDNRIGSYIPLYISGILYTIIFFRDRDAIENFEAYREQNPDGSRAFSVADIMDIVEEASKRKPQGSDFEEYYIHETTNPIMSSPARASMNIDKK